MKKVLFLVLCMMFAAMANAALLEHLTFDAAGADPVLGTAASIDTVDMKAGAGSLALSGAPTTDTAGSDGAVTATSYDWSAGDVRTVAFWMKATSGDVGDANPTMISLGSGTGGGNRFDIRLAGDALRLEVQAGGTTTTSNIADGSWHHVAIVVPVDPAVGTDVEYYIDGAYVANFGFGTAIATGAGPLRVGDSYQDVGRDFKGGIDDVQMYDEALDAAEIAFLYNNPGTPFVDAAYGPAPANGKDNVVIDAQLSWQAPATYSAVGYDVWFGTEPNELNANYDMEKIVSKQPGLTADPALHSDITTGDMAYDTQYVWWVDAYEPNTVDILHPGEVWTFTTEPEVPTVTDPISVTTVPPATSATLTVTHTRATSYKWFKDNAEYSGGPLTADGEIELVIDPVVGDHTYRCEVYNDAGSDVSEDAVVREGRLIGHWDFDENLDSTVDASHAGTYVDPNEANDPPTPNYTPVSDANNLPGKGQAFVFAEDPLHVRIGGDVGDFNFYTAGYTVNTWIKTTESSYGATVTKQALDNSAGFLLSHNGGTAIHAIRPGSATTTAAGAINDDQWHMITGSYDAATGQVSLYIDGEQVRTATKTNVPLTDQPLIFGTELTDGTVPYEGLLDEVRIWNYPRSKEEVGQEYYDVTGIVPCINEFDGSVYDFDGNCIVDLSDFAELANYWLDNGLLPL